MTTVGPRKRQPMMIVGNSDYLSGSDRVSVATGLPIVEHGRGSEGKRHCAPATLPFNMDGDLSDLSYALPLTDYHVTRVPRERPSDPSAAPTSSNRTSLSADDSGMGDGDEKSLLSPMNALDWGSDSHDRRSRKSAEYLSGGFSPMGARTG